MDHSKKALSRVYWQYRNSPKLLEWLQILPRIAQAKIELPLARIADILDIDNASGQLLDIVGRIAGIERPRIRTDALKVFGYNGTPATLDDVKRAVDFILGVDCTVIDGQNTTMATVWFEGNVAENMLALAREFDIIPRPQGVKIRKMATNEYPFAYKGTFSAQPYGVGRYVTPT